MMNESWFDDPAVITGGVAFALTKAKQMPSLRTAFFCEKIGIQLVCWMLDVGDWPDASVCPQARHSGRSAYSKGAWRAEVSCGRPDHLISRKPTAVESGKIGVM